MTAHRRENFGLPLERIFGAVRDFAVAHPECHVVYPVHPNPNVQGPARAALGGVANVSLIPPVGYREMVFLLGECTLVLTDSGGLQEEAPSLGKPVLVLRESTERPEAVSAGCARLVGSDAELIRRTLESLVREHSREYEAMSRAQNPFGDGTAAERITRILEDSL
jgi:UDP-N-acetylglucosamine 2-epimerase (non-hydrolysing)